MRPGFIRRLMFPFMAVLNVILLLSGSARAQEPSAVKEINFVFLHGAGGNSCSLQLLSDSVMSRAQRYINEYRQANPGFTIRVDSLLRCYPNDVDIETWAKNIVQSIDQYYGGRKNLVLVGHSMGGKTALYAVAHNTGGIADRVSMVATINTPVRSFGNYVMTSTVPLTYIGTPFLVSDRGVVTSIFTYDSSQDGNWVGKNKHWLAFTSGETSPMSPAFDVRGLDAMPRNMDDTIVPVSGQYADGADVVYYGAHGHSEFGESNEVSGFLANQILNYIFGGRIGFSVEVKKGVIEHQAGWLPVIDRWKDTVGEMPVDSGTIKHKNESLTRWQEWDDIVGKISPDFAQSSFSVRKVSSFPLLTGIISAGWLSPLDPTDCRLYIVTRAAPGNTVTVEWSIFQKGLLPDGQERDRYEIEIVTGTPFTAISGASWASENPRDLKMTVSSQAEGPFRWFQAEWKAFRRENRSIGVINEME